MERGRKKPNTSIAGVNTCRQNDMRRISKKLREAQGGDHWVVSVKNC